MHNEITITNESQAFSALEKAVKEQFGDTPLSIKFSGWPILEIELEGDGYAGTITAEMAAGLVELQSAVNRSYSRMVHQEANSRKLTSEEKHEILFKAKVENGCSLLKIDFGPFAEKLATQLVDKMTTELLVISVVGIAVSVGSVAVIKLFLKHKSEGKKITVEAEKAIALSKEETKRMEVFAKAMLGNPALSHINDDFDEARNQIVKGTADAKTISLNDVSLDRETAKILSINKRIASTEVQLNGNYIIKNVGWEQEGEVRIKLSNENTARTFTASFKDDTFDKMHLNVLKDAEWSRQAVYLSINGTDLRGEITKATILSVKAQPTKKVTPL